MVSIDKIPLEVLICVPLVILIGLLSWLCINKPNEEIERVEPEIVKQEQKKKKKKKSKKNNQGDEASKPKIQKKKNVHKIVPEGKAAYCKYCEVYMVDDEQLENHSHGKKHLKNNVKRAENWYNITDNFESDEKPIFNYIEEKDETLEDDEWVL